MSDAGGGFSVVDYAHSFASERLKFASTQILLPELDIVDAAACSFRDLVEEAKTTGAFVAEEGFAVSDVVEQRTVSHQLSAISLEQESMARVRGRFPNFQIQRVQRFTG